MLPFNSSFVNVLPDRSVSENAGAGYGSKVAGVFGSGRGATAGLQPTIVNENASMTIRIMLAFYESRYHGERIAHRDGRID
jgi:hypothetical protein